MALHGTVEVNRETLYEWSAKRTTPTPNGVNVYECALYDRLSTIATTTVEHDYDDGALALAARVLAWAAEAQATATEAG